VTEPTYDICPYCGTQGPPVVLVRADGSLCSSDRLDEHATDCPYFRPTVQPRRVLGPTLFGRL
jgi:hypothetical protein